MRILFVFPRWRKLLEAYPELKPVLAGYDVGHFTMAGLGIPSAAAALPGGCDVALVDQNLGPVNPDTPADLVALSFFTPQAAEAYALGDAFRARGVPVVAGGIHPTMAPADTLCHADAVVRGPVDTALWTRLLADRRSGTMRGLYEGRPDAPFYAPRRELFAASTYLRAGIVQTARGCTVDCPFCVVPGSYGRAIQFKPVGEVVEDVRAMPYACYFLADENLLFHDARNRGYRTALFDALEARRVRKMFFLAAYPFMLKGLDDAEIDRLYRAGCRQIYLVLGLMQPLRRELADHAFVDKVLAMKAAGIEMMATFTLGHDDDPPEVEPFVFDFCEKARTNLAEFTLWTPFPGTPVFDAMEKEGRLLTRDWGCYNGAQVVFRPLGQTPEALQERYLQLWKAFYGGMDAFEINKRYARGFGTGIFQKPAHGEPEA